MTTIATDGKTISADSMQCGHFTDQINAVKLYRIDGVVYGISGLFQSSMRYLNWVRAGRKKEDAPSLPDDFAVVFVKGGTAWHDGSLLFPVECSLPYAVGSGAVGAMGAMLAGKSPAHAVAIAAKLDPETGGKIRTMKC